MLTVGQGNNAKSRRIPSRFELTFRLLPAHLIRRHRRRLGGLRAHVHADRMQLGRRVHTGSAPLPACDAAGGRRLVGGKHGAGRPRLRLPAHANALVRSIAHTVTPDGLDGVAQRPETSHSGSAGEAPP